nr:peritrophin-48-like [Nomia melanderi]
MRDILFLVLVAATGIVTAIPNECPELDPWDKPVQLPHESDCNKYYKCLMGKKFLSDCDEDDRGNKLCFDLESKTCGPAEKCDCKHHLDPECKSVTDNHPWADPADNTGYYQCVKGKKVSLKCDQGKIFDPVKLACQSKGSDVKTCPPAGSQQTVRYWHECHCQLYYECRGGELVSRSCPAGQLFDHKLMKCVSSEMADCNKPKDPNGCPAHGNVDIPDPTNCYQYYRCEDGKKTLRRCEPGRAFDEYKRMCVWWTLAICNTRGTTVSPPTGCLNWPRSKKRHLTDCNRYYECVKGRIEPGKCLENHYFNEPLQTCDLPKNTNCVPQGGNPDCPATDCGKKRFPADEGCEWYWKCDNGEKRLKKCPDGLVYNKNTEMCDLPKNVKCDEPKPPRCTPGERDPHECQCNMYYVCNGDKDWAVRYCPKGMNFDCDTSTCKDPKEARCCTRNKNYEFNNATSLWYR